MSLRLSLDRFEGDRKQIAVLVSDDGQTVSMPKSLLPPGTKPGDVLTFTLERDAAPAVRSQTKPAASRTSSQDATPVEISSCEYPSL